jgi:ABC-2 type transport system ATP-binding protein
MREPEKICDRVGIISAGRLIQVGAPDDLRRSVEELSVLEVESPSLSSEQIHTIRNLSDVMEVTYRESILRVASMRKKGLVQDVTRVLLESGADIVSVNTKAPTLEDAFISLTGGEDEIDRFLEKSS